MFNDVVRECKVCAMNYSNNLKKCPCCGELNPRYEFSLREINAVQGAIEVSNSKLDKYVAYFYKNLLFVAFVVILWVSIYFYYGKKNPLFDPGFNDFIAYVFNTHNICIVSACILSWMKLFRRPKIFVLGSDCTYIECTKWSITLIYVFIMFFACQYLHDLGNEYNITLFIVLSKGMELFFMVYPIYALVVEPSFQFFKIFQLTRRVEKLKERYKELQEDCNHAFNEG